jgi:hypothetical protein
MTKLKLQKLVDRAVALHREVSTKTEELKALKAELVQEAKLHPDALADTANGGKRWIAEGTDGCIARVNFPAASLVSEIDANGDLARQCQNLAGDQFRHLFAPVKFYQLAEDFRRKVAALLPSPKAEELTQLCESEAAPRVSFETTKQEAATPSAR